MQAEPDEIEMVKLTVRNPCVMETRNIYALVDVDLEIAGITISIIGVQARHTKAGGTFVALPTRRTSDGQWSPAITLPDDLRKSLTQAVLEFLVQERIAHNRLLKSFPLSGLP